MDLKQRLEGVIERLAKHGIDGETPEPERIAPAGTGPDPGVFALHDGTDTSTAGDAASANDVSRPGDSAIATEADSPNTATLLGQNAPADRRPMDGGVRGGDSSPLEL